MSTQRTVTAEFTVRNEILDWFKNLLSKKCGPHIPIQYRSNDSHFNICTEIKITGGEDEINQPIEFLQNTSEISRYKMPWVHGAPYYVACERKRREAVAKLDAIIDVKYDLVSNSTTFNIFGAALHLFYFRPNLDHCKMQQINEIFNTLAGPIYLFLTYPETRVSERNRSMIAMGTHILTIFHGLFLSYLSLEDILALEMANKSTNSCWDEDLDRDIQKFLRNNFQYLYNADGTNEAILSEFRSTEVIGYCIDKYHASISGCFISKILPGNEGESLKNSCKYEKDNHDIIHVDFKPADASEIVDFCGTYHYGPGHLYFINYGRQFASKNCFLNYIPDNKSNETCAEFTHFVLKSVNNCSPAKTDAILKYVTKHFKAKQGFISIMTNFVLNEFDLNHVHNDNLSAMLKMTAGHWLKFENMNINLGTLTAIVDLSNRNWIEIRRCNIILDNTVETFSSKPNNWKNICIRFVDMDIEFHVTNFIKGFIADLEFDNCRILSTPRTSMAKLGLMSGTHYARNLKFVSCVFSSDFNIQQRNFTLQKNLYFANSLIQSQTLVQLLENFEVQNQIVIHNGYFRFENVIPRKFHPKPGKLEFHNSTFEPLALHTIHSTLHNESRVKHVNSYISSVEEHTVSTKNSRISIKYIEFIESRLEMQTLLNMLGKTSRKTELHFYKCDILLNLNVLNRKVVNTLTELYYHDMKFSMHHLVAILNSLDQGSTVIFDKCEITEPLNIGERFKFNQHTKITIGFTNMFINLHLPVFRQKNWTIYLKGCHLKFETLPFNFIESHVKFVNIPFDLDKLFTIMERVAETTKITIYGCDLNPTRMISTQPLRSRCFYIGNVQLKIKTMLSILNSFSSQGRVQFNNCKILYSDLNKLPPLKLNLANINFSNMDLKVHLFQNMVQRCTEHVLVEVQNCNFIPVADNILNNLPINVNYLILRNVNYSPELLQIIQNLKAICTVEYDGWLSTQAIIEISTKTLINGPRLRLLSPLYTELIYFELFSEFFRTEAFNFNFDPEMEYDIPAHVIPYISVLDGKKLEYSWEEFKIKITFVNDTTEKVDFLRHGKPIELFYLLNGLQNDFDERLVNHD